MPLHGVTTRLGYPFLLQRQEHPDFISRVSEIHDTFLGILDISFLGL